MAIEDIIKKIESDTKKEVDLILQEAKARAGEIEDEAKKEIEARDQELLRVSKARAEQRKKQIIVDANLKARNIVMQKKTELVNAVFESLKKKISGLDKEKTRKMAEKMMLSAPISGEEEVILPHGHSSWFDKDFFNKVNKSLKPGSLHPAEEKGSFEWGFILSGKGCKMDFTVDALLVDMRDKAESETAKILFGDTKK